jgi:hypothetical protein
VTSYLTTRTETGHHTHKQAALGCLVRDTLSTGSAETHDRHRNARKRCAQQQVQASGRGGDREGGSPGRERGRVGARSWWKWWVSFESRGSIVALTALLLNNGSDQSKPCNACHDMKRMMVTTCSCSNNGSDQSKPCNACHDMIRMIVTTCSCDTWRLQLGMSTWFCSAETWIVTFNGHSHNKEIKTGEGEKEKEQERTHEAITGNLQHVANRVDLAQVRVLVHQR